MSWIDKIQKNYLDYLKFIIKIIFGVLVLYFITPLLAKLFILIFNKDIPLSDFILLITAALIMAYTYET